MGMELLETHWGPQELTGKTLIGCDGSAQAGLEKVRNPV